MVFGEDAVFISRRDKFEPASLDCLPGFGGLL